MILFTITVLGTGSNYCKYSAFFVSQVTNTVAFTLFGLGNYIQKFEVVVNIRIFKERVKC